MNQLETLQNPTQWYDVGRQNGEFGLPRLYAHRQSWPKSIAEGLGHRWFLIRAHQPDADGEDMTTGVLPLVLMKGLFGRFLVSVPYINTGGVWSDNERTATDLIDRACELADELNVKYLELRHERPVAHARLNFERTEKVHMRLDLPTSEEALMKSFKAKLRNQIKKSGEYDLRVEFGGIELLKDFYAVFAYNMRDLGTPVFSQSLFKAILREFAEDAEFAVVYKGSKPIAGGFLIHYPEGTTEVPSASCLRAYNRTNANMFLYAELLKRAIGRGSTTFDFGRSSQGSGTYKFKAQWGAREYAAVWQYYVRAGSPDDMRPDAAGKQRLVQIWQRLPVALTRLVGPSIIRGIP